MKIWIIFLFFLGKQFLQKNYMEKKFGEKKGKKKRTCYPLMKKGRIPSTTGSYPLPFIYILSIIMCWVLATWDFYLCIHLFIYSD